MFNDNLPPGVSPNDPHLTGEWPCDECGGCGYDEDEDGKHACILCEGKGFMTGEEHQGRCRDCGTITSAVDPDTDEWLCEECVRSAE